MSKCVCVCARARACVHAVSLCGLAVVLQEEQVLSKKQQMEIMEEKLLMYRRQGELKMLQEKERIMTSERQLQQKQRVKASHLEMMQRRSARFRRRMWRENAAMSYADFLATLRVEESTVSKMFSDDNLSIGTGVGSVMSSMTGTTTATGSTGRSSADEYDQSMRAMRAEEERIQAERAQRDEEERAIMLESQREEVQNTIAEGEARMNALRERHAEQVAALEERQSRERAKLIKKWKELDSEAKAEQSKHVEQARFRQAAVITEMEASQARELEHFRKTLELQSQLRGAESRGKLDFLGFVCHEVRNPLAGVCGLVELLLSDSVGGTRLNSEQLKFLHDIQSETTLMTAILNDVLDLGKIEAGKLEIEPREFDPYGVLESIVESRSAAMQASDKDVDLILEARGAPVRSWVS
ncbi:MAG: hypothetical protein EOO41_03755, partial [Methanobacteriota archaeon]